MNEFVERVQFLKSGSLYFQHLSRYNFARDFIGNKKVLDTACGTGYGTDYLSLGSPEIVVGVDISSEAIAHARANFSSQRTLFVRCDCRHIPLPTRWFDVITSFEFIEHIYEQSEYLLELNRLLKPGGCLIISTPNATLRRSGNPYHVRELSLFEFRDLLKSTFNGKIELFGQQFRESPILSLLKTIDSFHLRKLLVPYVHRLPQLIGSSKFKTEDNTYQMDDFVFRKQRLMDSFVLLAVIFKES
jgi:SAM-dependent methyltransferase